MPFHAGCLLELDLVARAHDVLVVGPGAVDRHDRIAGNVEDLFEGLPDPADGPAGQIEVELVDAVDDLRRLGDLHRLHQKPPCGTNAA